MRQWQKVVASFALLALAGCGPEQPRGEVEGRVTSGGKPVADLVVTFYPDADVGHTGPQVAGKTDVDGRFRLATVPMGARDSYRDGAITGTYRVSFGDLRAVDGTPSRLLPEYVGYHTTPLKGYEIKPGAQIIDLEIPLKAAAKGSRDPRPPAPDAGK